MRSGDPPPGSFSTLTHARLRALQGDYAAAEALLREILDREPGHRDAAELLHAIAGRRREGAAERDDGPPPAPEPAGVAERAVRFRETLGASPAARRIRRLERWLGRIQERS